MCKRVEENVDNTANEMSIYHLATVLSESELVRKLRKLHTLAYKLNKYTVLCVNRVVRRWMRLVRVNTARNIQLKTFII